MEQTWLMLAIVVVNMVVIGLLVAVKSSRLRASGGQFRPVSGSRRLILGVVAFCGLVLFITLLSIYFLRQAGS